MTASPADASPADAPPVDTSSATSRPPRTRVRPPAAGSAENGATYNGRHLAEQNSDDGDDGEQPPLRAEDITRVMLRPLASPLPMAFLALGIGTFLVSMQQVGVIPMSEMRDLYLLLAVFVTPVQITAAILAFQTREPLVASGIGLISLTWPTSVVVIYNSPTGMAPKSLALLYLAVSSALLLIGLPAVTAKPLLGILISIAASRFIFTGIYLLNNSVKIEYTSAAVGFLLVIGTAYAALAIGLEDVKHQTVLPIGRRGEAKEAFNGDLRFQIDSVATEAGVRRQL